MKTVTKKTLLSNRKSQYHRSSALILRNNRGTSACADNDSLRAPTIHTIRNAWNSTAETLKKKLEVCFFCVLKIYFKLAHTIH